MCLLVYPCVSLCILVYPCVSLLLLLLCVLLLCVCLAGHLLLLLLYVCCVNYYIIILCLYMLVLLLCYMFVLKEFVFAKSMISSNVEEIQEFMEESIKGNANNVSMLLPSRAFLETCANF